jgi:UDP-N-acetylmuramoylalanine--D-glutamate ligase
MDVKGKNVLVVGLGASGLSMARWLSRHGARVRVADSRESPPAIGLLQRDFPGLRMDTGPFRQASFDQMELLAMSPGVPLAEPLVQAAIRRGVPAVGDMELFAWARAGMPQTRVIAITGSNGKSTVTEMTGALCRACGADTVVAGNIGLPVLDALSDIEAAGTRDRSWHFVLELSSFQLETTSTLHADAATILNVSEDHLDRYPDMDAYAAAKAKVYQGPGVRVVNRDDVPSRGLAPSGSIVTFGLDAPSHPHDWGVVRDSGGTWLAHGQDRLLQAGELQVAGLHNVANALAAMALGHAVGLPIDPMIPALRAFRGLAHRVEQVADIGGVTFFDDSKGTNVGATVAALNGLTQPVVLIAGGDGKGQNFAPLAPAVRDKARAVVLIGRDGKLIAEILKETGVALHHAVDLKEAVRLSLSLALPGDAVLLSPACASFDMFRNYQHRAEVFVAAVKELLH